MNEVAVVLEGSFDVTDRDKLREAFGYALAARTVIVDLAGVDFLDSSVIGGFVLLHRAVRSRAGRLVFTGVRSMTDRMFRLSGLDGIFDVRPALGGVAAELGVDESQIEHVIVSTHPQLASTA